MKRYVIIKIEINEPEGVETWYSVTRKATGTEACRCRNAATADYLAKYLDETDDF